MSDWLHPDEARKALEFGDGRGVRIAVLDSGVEVAHPDFNGRQLTDDVVVEFNRPLESGGGEDIYGHGTAIAGIIWKLAPKAEIGSFRVLGKNLRARSAQISLAAVEAMKRGYHILNCSFGCGISAHMPLYKEWVDRACLSGIHVVAASCAHDRPEWPADFTSVLGVDCSADVTSASLYHRAGHVVEFAAPSKEENVAWKHGSHRTMMGSSFAAAHLSGLLARLLSVHSIEDPLLAKALLRQVFKKAPEELSITT